MALPTTVRRPQTQTDPFGDLQREFDVMLNRLFGGQPQTTTGRRSAPYPVDVREDQDHLYFEVELPGFTRDQLDITLEDRTLQITAERDADAENKVGDLLLNERRHTYFSRSFQLPPTIDEGAVQAKLTDGVLHITLNKREESKPRKIEVG
ncbi:MAG: Hsp20/alpha crystallin family protein [Planctomycetota bacterium]